MITGPELLSREYALYNYTEDAIIFSRSPETKVEIASLTKIMTALLAIENNPDLQKTIVVTGDMLAWLNGFAVLGLQVGQTVTLNDLLYATLLPSAADAAQALAISTAGSIDAFVNMMNEKATALGLYDTTFTDATGGRDFSTASDLINLLKYALNNPIFRQIFETNEYYINSMGQKIIKTTAETAQKYGLDISRIAGSKTGFTYSAGRCLISEADLDGTNFIMVVLGNPENSVSHITDTITTYNYFADNYAYRKILDAGQVIYEIPVRDSFQKSYNVTAPEEVVLYLRNDLDLESLAISYIGDQELTREDAGKTELGKIQVADGDEILYETEVKLNQEISYFHYEVWAAGAGIVVGVALLVIALAVRRKKLRRRSGD